MPAGWPHIRQSTGQCHRSRPDTHPVPSSSRHSATSRSQPNVPPWQPEEFARAHRWAARSRPSNGALDASTVRAPGGRDRDWGPSRDSMQWSMSAMRAPACTSPLRRRSPGLPPRADRAAGDRWRQARNLVTAPHATSGPCRSDRTLSSTSLAGAAVGSRLLMPRHCRTRLRPTSTRTFHPAA